MISDRIRDALIDQINAELYSAYLYMSMASCASYKGYKGTANWFSIQTQEELSHTQKMYDYVNSHGAHVILKAIEQPPSDFDSMQVMFEEALKHEKKVTALIHELVHLAREEKDYATEVYLQWFVSEQVEEEENAGDILDQLKMAGGSGGALLMIDRELGSRTFNPPSATE